MEEKAKARKIWMKPFADNRILAQDIPEIAARLFKEEFDVAIRFSETPQLAFALGWRAYCKFARSQPTPEFSINITGASLEYVTDFSESDKSRNITPQIIYHQDPLFKPKEHSEHIGFKSNAEMAQDYETWRSENLTETVEKINTDVQSQLFNDYGIDTTVSQAVIPLMGATLAAGLYKARETGQKINMYNVLSIEIMDGDKVIYTPDPSIKYAMKHDEVKG